MKCPKCGGKMTLGVSHAGPGLQYECHVCGTIVLPPPSKSKPLYLMATTFEDGAKAIGRLIVQANNSGLKVGSPPRSKRGGSRKYYKKESHREKMKDHRRYKYQTLKGMAKASRPPGGQ